MHELITNIFKHAYQKGRPLIIDIKSVIEDNGMLVTTVADNGRGLSKQINPETCTSLGISISQSIIQHQLRGSISFASTTEGLTVTVSVPVDNELSSIYTHTNN